MKETLDLDAWLTSLASSLNVIVMPGAKDPAKFTLPQDELPSFFFPTASTYSTLQRATNPCLASVAGRRLLGTAGRNIDNLAKQSAAKGPIDHSSGRWRHVAPTAPDTLGCYSFDDSDPFVIEKCPHVYFAGNQDTFASRLVEGPQGQKCRSSPCPRLPRPAPSQWSTCVRWTAGGQTRGGGAQPGSRLRHQTSLNSPRLSLLASQQV